MTRHTRDMSTPRSAWVTPSEQRIRDIAYRTDTFGVIFKAATDRQDAYAIETAASISGKARTQGETRAAYDLTDDQAAEWIASKEVFSSLTVNAVMMDDRKRVLAARHAMKGQ